MNSLAAHQNSVLWLLSGLSSGLSSNRGQHLLQLQLKTPNQDNKLKCLPWQSPHLNYYNGIVIHLHYLGKGNAGHIFFLCFGFVSQLEQFSLEASEGENGTYD